MSTDDLSDVERRILSLFGVPSDATTTNLDRSAIRSRIKRQTSGAYSKREVGRALKGLAKKGRLQKTGHDYSLPPAQDDSSASHSGESSSDDDASSDPVMPIAQRMRRQFSAVKGGAPNDQVAAESKTDIDDEIRRLEAELAADEDCSEDDESDVDSHGDDDVPREKMVSFGTDSVHEYAPEIKSKRVRPSPDGAEADPSRGVICLSSVADERIAPLPSSALPQSARRKLKIDSADDGAAGTPKSKKRRRSDDDPGDGGRCHQVSEGLRSAVRELLADYVPASQLDRPAFYCRVCRHQSSSKEEFDAHRSTQLHEAAVREEKKKTYCKLCRKQLTSLVQMEEHLKSKPHRAKMDAVKARQRGTGRGGAPRGRGRGRNSNSRGRQWC